MGLFVELENAMDFGDGFGVEGRSVAARDDALTLGTVEVATPVSDDAVAAVRSVPATAVTDDGMIGNLFGHRDLIDCHNETVVRGQGVHAVGKTLHLQRRRVGGQ